MKIALIILFAMLFLFLVFCVISAHIMVKRITNPIFKTREERNETNRIDGFLNGIEAYKREPIVFEMSDGYKINGDISLNNPKKFVIFAHGHASNREGSIKFTKLFYDLGYSLVLYDHRGHGDNVRKPLTMGIKESKDLSEIVKRIQELFGEDIEIGLFGYSMGGATVCLSSQYLQKDLKFIVCDCAYSSLRSECHNQCIVHKIPFIPTILFMRLFFKIKYAISFKECNVKEAIKYNKVPVCFFHGTNDRTVFFKNSEELFNASSSEKKKIYLFEGAGHSRCIELDPVSYKEKVKDFINDTGG